jgi:succinate dehydrogenase hydrophobic anchor subunit
MATHLRVVGWLRILWSLLGALFWLYALTFLHGVGAPLVHRMIHDMVQSPGSASLSGSPSAPSTDGPSAGGSDDQAAILEQVTAQVMTVLTVLFAVLAFFQLLAAYSGWALMAYRPWARPFNIVVSLFDLLSVPIGTAIAVYSLWVLFRPETIALFARRPTEQDPTHL